MPHIKKLPQPSVKEFPPAQPVKMSLVSIKEEPESMSAPVINSEGINGTVQDEKHPDDSILEMQNNCSVISEKDVDEEEEKAMDLGKYQ